MHQGNVVIVGAAESPRIGVVPDSSTLDLHAQAALRALRDAGIQPREVDGIATSFPMTFELADYLGITATWMDGTGVGGASTLLHVRHAAAAIASGAADIVLVTHGESGRSRIAGRAVVPDPRSLTGQFEQPYGAVPPYAKLTLPALAYMEANGVTREDLALVTVAQRAWAEGNPRAMRSAGVDITGVIESGMVAYPFTKDMCCVVSDGGGAIVLTSAARARQLELRSQPVYLMGSGESSGVGLVSQLDDLTSFAALERSSRQAFATAGIIPSEIDHFMLYDAFAHLPLMMLENSGFVPPGRAKEIYRGGRAHPGGDMPINTNGGGLSYTHTGMYGMFLLLEAVRQLRDEAFRQVENVTTSFVQGIGMMYGVSGTLILSNQK